MSFIGVYFGSEHEIPTSEALVSVNHSCICIDNYFFN